MGKSPAGRTGGLSKSSRFWRIGQWFHPPSEEDVISFDKSFPRPSMGVATGMEDQSHG